MASFNRHGGTGSRRKGCLWTLIALPFQLLVVIFARLLDLIEHLAHLGTAFFANPRVALFIREHRRAFSIVFLLGGLAIVFGAIILWKNATTSRYVENAENPSDHYPNIELSDSFGDTRSSSAGNPTPSLVVKSAAPSGPAPTAIATSSGASPSDTAAWTSAPLSHVVVGDSASSPAMTQAASIDNSISQLPQPSQPDAFPGEHFPETRLRVLSESEARGLSSAELQYAINEIFARHGADFKNKPELKRVFMKFSWYKPDSSLTFDDIELNKLSDVEEQNVKLLGAIRNATKVVPYARRVPGRPGYVTSPYSPDDGYIDVRGFPRGTEVKDPINEGKTFLVP